VWAGFVSEGGVKDLAGIATGRRERRARAMNLQRMEGSSGVMFRFVTASQK